MLEYGNIPRFALENGLECVDALIDILRARIELREIHSQVDVVAAERKCLLISFAGLSYVTSGHVSVSKNLIERVLIRLRRQSIFNSLNGLFRSVLPHVELCQFQKAAGLTGIGFQCRFKLGLSSDKIALRRIQESEMV